jgi:hypothetical protein
MVTSKSRLGDVDLVLARGGLEGVVEAGRPAAGEELLGVGAGSTVAAHVRGDGQVEVELVVAGDDLAGASAPGGGGCGVNGVGHDCLLSGRAEDTGLAGLGSSPHKCFEFETTVYPP